MAKVHIRDGVKADLEARYPGEQYTFSDRVLKLMTELDTYQTLAARSQEVPSPHTPQRSVADEALAEDLVELVTPEDEDP